MNLLIIGGTQFVGRHMAEIALMRGHHVTLFNRGKTNPNAIEHDRLDSIQGDRDGEISNLGERTWDAVIDMCGYVPRVVGLSADYLKARVKQYCFISTISVYADDNEPFYTEATGKLNRLEDPITEDISGGNYGGLKVLCEQVVQDKFADALIIRPGLIIGPYDHTNRFSYWPHRASLGGDLLAPEPRDEHFQIIDARDLAHFTLRLVERNVSGIFNATGPSHVMTFEDMVKTCVRVCNANTKISWVSEAFLLENGVNIWTDLPLWVGSQEPALNRVTVDKGIEYGLVYRPFAETVRDTLDWLTQQENASKDKPKSTSLSLKREKALLALWHKDS